MRNSAAGSDAACHTAATFITGMDQVRQVDSRGAKTVKSDSAAVAWPQ